MSYVIQLRDLYFSKRGYLIYRWWEKRMDRRKSVVGRLSVSVWRKKKKDQFWCNLCIKLIATFWYKRINVSWWAKLWTNKWGRCFCVFLKYSSHFIQSSWMKYKFYNYTPYVSTSYVYIHEYLLLHIRNWKINYLRLSLSSYFRRYALREERRYVQYFQ